MPTKSCRQEYSERLLDLAWSLWAELGVSGWQRSHSHWVIDPEELLVFTAWLGDRDARLREECVDWCIRSGDTLSVDRLKNLLEPCDEATKASFGQMTGLVALNKGPKLPYPTSPKHTFKPSRKSDRPDPLRPAALVIRLRKLLGIGAKAELLARLLEEPARAITIAELVAEGVGFARVTIAQALDDLVEAGAVALDHSQRDGRYQLARRPGLLEALDLQIGWRPPWGRLFRLLRHGDALLAAAPAKDPAVAAMDFLSTERLVGELARDLGCEPTAERMPGGRSYATLAGHFIHGAGRASNLADGLLVGDVSVLDERKAARSSWLVAFASAVAAGERPPEATPSWVGHQEAHALTALRSVRSRFTARSGYRPNCGSDELLRALATRRPMTVNEARLLAGPDVELDGVVLAAYVTELQRALGA